MISRQKGAGTNRPKGWKGKGMIRRQDIIKRVRAVRGHLNIIFDDIQDGSLKHVLYETAEIKKEIELIENETFMLAKQTAE